MKLKTLKDMDRTHFSKDDRDMDYVCVHCLKEELVKWIKALESGETHTDWVHDREYIETLSKEELKEKNICPNHYNLIDWIKHVFNIENER